MKGNYQPWINHGITMEQYFESTSINKKLDSIIKLLKEADAIEKKLNEAGVKCEFILHD